MPNFAQLVLAWTWQPIASPRHIFGGAIVLLALALFTYLRVYSARPISSLILLGMRLAAVAALTILLFGPSRELPQPEATDRPQLTVLIDTSESMATADCGGDARITHVARNVFDAGRLERLEQDFDVVVQSFSDHTAPLPLYEFYADPPMFAAGTATHLADSVASAVTQTRGVEDRDVMLVISDGRDTSDASIQPAAAAARAKHIPVYTIPIGGSTSVEDAAILAVPMQDSLLPGETGAVLVKIYQSGLDGQSTTLRIRHGDQEKEFPVDFRDKRVVELQVPISEEEPGQYRYEVSIDPAEGETETSNNWQTVFSEVMKRRMRVFILEGQPFWDTKFLAQSLRKDERIELTQITQVGAEKRETIVSRVEESSPGLPSSIDEWSDYDVVILGRGLENVLDRRAAEQLVEYVVSGGGRLVLARGPAYAPQSQLADVLDVLSPVEWGDQDVRDLSLRLTASGHSSAWLTPLKMGIDVDDALQRLSGFEVMPSVVREKPGTIVLARAVGGGGATIEGPPALTRMDYGRGTIVSILGEGLWRWSLLPPDAQDLRGFYDTFWSNLVRWLALGGDFPPGEQVSLQLSRTTARLGDELTIDVAYKHAPPGDVPPTLQLADPDGTTEELSLHRLPGAFPRYRATVQPESTGIHAVNLRAPGMNPQEAHRNFNVYDVNLERLQTAVNPLPLQMLAEHSGGVFLEDGTADSLLEHLERHLASMEMPPRLEYIWDSGWVLTVLLMWMGLEWIVRRTAGLW